MSDVINNVPVYGFFSAETIEALAEIFDGHDHRTKGTISHLAEGTCETIKTLAKNVPFTERDRSRLSRAIIECFVRYNQRDTEVKTALWTTNRYAVECLTALGISRPETGRKKSSAEEAA